MSHDPPAPARFFFLNTTFAIVFVAVCLIGGWLSFTTMTRENYPDLAIPQATVVVEWPGATPGQMEEEVTNPLEQAVRAIPGLRTYSSSSQNSTTVLIVEFRAEVDLATAMRDLRTRVEEARARFPQDVRTPDVQQISVNDTPILTFSVFGEVDDDTLTRSAQALERDLEQIAGVRQVTLQGLRDRAVHIRLDPARLRLLGLSPGHVRERIETVNQDLAWGTFEGEMSAFPLYLEGRFRDLDDIRQIVVARLGGDRIVRLDEVATVFIGLRERDRATHVSIDGEPFRTAVTVTVLKRPGADTMATIDEVRERLAAFTIGADWPSALSAIEISSEGTLIEDSFEEVTSNLGQGVLAVFIILLTALTWREALVAAIALPVAMLAALLTLNLFGYTLNTLVILGAVIALGIIVDVFILVMEGMHDGIYVKKMRFDEAALDTVKTYALPAIAGQTTTILAMVPLLTIAGIDGKFIRQIPISAIACLVASVTIAFLVCIPLSRFLLGGKHEAKTTAMDRLAARAGNGLQAILLRGPLRAKWAAASLLGLVVLALIFSLDAASRLPQIIYPPEDRRNIGATILLSPDAPFARTERVAAEIGEALRPLDYIETVSLHVGEASPFALKTLSDYLVDTTTPNMLGISIRLTDKDDRARPSWDYVVELRDTLDQVVSETAGAEFRLSPDLGGSTSADPIQVEVTGPEMEALRAAASSLRVLLERTPGVTDVRENLGDFRTEVRFETRSEALSFYGIGEDDLMDQVRIAMMDDKIGTYAMPGTEPDLDIRIGMDFPSREGVGGPRELFELETIPVISPSGERVLVDRLVDTTLRPVPVGIVHADGRRAVTISARTTAEVTPLAVIAALEPQVAAIADDWSAGMSWRFRGEVESSAETYGSTGQALLIAVGLVFAVLALLFQSFRQPFIIMTIAPLSMTGVFGGFAALDISISFPAMIGVIALLGIIVNDSIVIVQVTNNHLAKGLSLKEAAAHGAADRLRPILTTSITTIVGLTPLALSSPAWYPLCMAVILGLAAGTVLALLVVPSLYLLLTKDTAPKPDAPTTDGVQADPKAPQKPSEAGALIRLSVPIIAGLAASLLLGVTDTIMVAPLGTVHLAAVSLAAAALIILYSALYGFLSPIGVEVAQRYGRGDHDGVRLVLKRGLSLAAIAGILAAAVMAAAYLLLPWFGQPDDVIAAVRLYWFAISLVLTSVAGLMAVSLVLNAIDRAWTAAGFAFFGVLLNVPLNYVMIWGVGEWDGLGLLGAGIATVTADAIALAVALEWLRRKGFLSSHASDDGLTKRLAREGTPLTIAYVGEGAAYSVVGILLGLFGAAALAANQIIQSVSGVLYVLPLGMATATTVRIGQAIGAGQMHRLRRIASTAILIVSGWMVLVTLGLAVTGRHIAGALSSDLKVIGIATSMFIVVATMQVLEGVQSTALGALRGIKDFVWPTGFTLTVYWFFALPLGYLVGFVFDYGPIGLWAGYGAGIAAAAIALPWRFWRLTGQASPADCSPLITPDGSARVAR